MKLLRSALLALALCTAAHAADDFKIVTASERGTYYPMGQDLAKLIAEPNGQKLTVLPSKGSVENVKRLRYDSGVKMAFVQSDVYQAFLDRADAGDRDARDIIRPLRVITPLYNEEIYYIARVDNPINYVHELRDQVINIGPIGSGTALTTATMYKLMYGVQLPEVQSMYSTNEEALQALLSGNTKLQVVAIIGGQPTKLLADMRPEIKSLIKLLKFDPSNELSQRVLSVYFPATIRQVSYPNLLDADMPGIAVKAFLVTYDFENGKTRQSNSVAAIAKFSTAFCQNFAVLQDDGHSKWRDVDISVPYLGKNWDYYDVTYRPMKSCVEESKRKNPPAPAETKAAIETKSTTCTQQARLIGLCQ